MKRLIFAVSIIALVALFSDPLAAQVNQLGQQRLGRPYWHVFASYAIAWVLVLGWVVSIFRRLRRVESRMSSLDAE